MLQINTFQYNPTDMDCNQCPKYGGKEQGCTAKTCPWLAKRIEADVAGYEEAIRETFPHDAHLDARLRTVVRHFTDSLFLDPSHEQRIVCYDIKELGKQLKQLGMLVIQDQVWNRVTVNRGLGKTTRYYVDEFHLLLKGELASWSVEIWKRFRKWGGVPTGITQNIKDLLASREIENIFENSDFIYMSANL